MHFGDYTFIFLLALVLFGPKKMPEMGRQLGKLLAEFRRASNEFKFQIQEELRVMEEEERRKKLAESQALAAASDLAMSEAGVTGRADAGPTILPPSTGAPVSAERPFAYPEQDSAERDSVAALEAGSENGVGHSALPAHAEANREEEFAAVERAAGSEARDVPAEPLNGASPAAQPASAESISHA